MDLKLIAFCHQNDFFAVLYPAMKYDFRTGIWVGDEFDVRGGADAPTVCAYQKKTQRYTVLQLPLSPVTRNIARSSTAVPHQKPLVARHDVNY